MSDQKDAARLLNQQFPIWKFLGKKEFWEAASTSPTIYISFLILMFGGAELVLMLFDMHEAGTSVLSPGLFALAALLMLAVFMGGWSAFQTLRVQQLKKHLELIQRAQENKE